MTENEKILTQINQITQMGQAGINCVMSRTTQPALRQALRVQRLEYQSIGAKAKILAKNKGLEIKNGSSFVHRMTNMATGAKLLKGGADEKDSMIAGMMIQGNTRGMIQSLKQMHRATHVDPDVAQLSQKLLDTEINNIRQMEGFV